MVKRFISKNEEETRRFGRRLGRILRGGDVIALCGELGSGKTVLTKGIAEGLGVTSARYVNSPSFVILKEYRGRLTLYHFDIYRLQDSSEFETVGYNDYFYASGVSVIEWADKVADVLPSEFLRVDLKIVKEGHRDIKLTPVGTHYKNVVKRL